MAAEARGSAVLAIRRLKKPATPAAAPIGPSTTGSHIILLPKLALSCSKKISAAVTSAPTAVSADSARSKWPVSTLAIIRSRPDVRLGPARILRLLPSAGYRFRRLIPGVMTEPRLPLAPVGKPRTSAAAGARWLVPRRPGMRKRCQAEEAAG